MAVVTTTCHNPKCPKRVNVWRSQPNMPGTQRAYLMEISFQCLQYWFLGISHQGLQSIPLHGIKSNEVEMLFTKPQSCSTTWWPLCLLSFKKRLMYVHRCMHPGDQLWQRNLKVKYSQNAALQAHFFKKSRFGDLQL